MKVTFIYTTTKEGYKMEEHYEDIPKFLNSEQYDYKEYYKCLKAIADTVEDHIKSQEKWHKDLKKHNYE